MMSESSFSVRLFANLKRRIWVIALSAICCLFSTLGLLISYYSRINSYNERGMYSTVASFQLAMRQSTSDCLVFNSTISVVTMILAAVIALQGFSYLHNRSKLDFYMSQPVSAAKRYNVIVVGSFLIYIVPLLISVGLSIACAFANQAISVAVLQRSLISLINYILLFAAIYFTVLLAIMLTGNMTMAVLGSFVFIICEIAIREAFEALMSNFLLTHDYSFDVTHGHISTIMVQQQIWKLNMNYTNTGIPWSDLGTSLMLLFANSLVFALLARLCYGKRDGEAAGKSLVFNQTRGPIKIIVGTVSSLVFNIILLDFAEYSVFTAFIAITVASVLTGAIIQLLLDGSVASAIKGVPSTLAICVLTLAVFGCVHWDVFGYDKYTPAIEDMDSYAITFHCDINSGNWYDFTESDNPDYVNPYQYLKNNLYMTDNETIVELAQLAIRDTSAISYDNLGKYRDYSVLYRLKNGRTIARHMWLDVNDENVRRLISKIMSNQDYILAHEPAVNTLGEANLSHIYDVTYSFNGVEEKLDVDGTAIFEALKTDLLNNYSYEMLSSELPYGTINIRYNRYYYTPVSIYSGYTNVLSLLEAAGIEPLKDLNPADVSYIEITNYNDIAYDDYNGDIAAEAVDETAYASTYQTHRYTDPDEIAAILENVVLHCRMNNYWYDDLLFEDNINVLISLKVDVAKNSCYSINNSGNIKKDCIPDFVLADFGR